MSKKLSKRTIKNYEHVLKQNNITSENLNDDCINSKLESLGSSNKQMLISGIFWKYPNLDIEIKNKYREYLIKLIKETVSKMETNEKTDGQILNYIEWERVLEIRDEIFKTGKDNEKLIISLYTMLPPRRLEYMYLEKAEHTDLMNNKEINYYYEKDDVGYIKFNNYKQRENKYKSITIKLPDELNKIIKETCKNRIKLFPKIKHPASFSKKISNIFKKYGENKNISVQILRHSFVSYIEKTGLSVQQQKIISELMGHSFTMNRMYSKNGKSDNFEWNNLIVN